MHWWWSTTRPIPFAPICCWKFQSLGIPRDLYIFTVEGDLPGTVPADHSKTPRRPALRHVLVKDVEIPPGENSFIIYTAHAGTVVGDETRNFAVRDGSLRSGRMVFDFAFDVYGLGEQRVEIRPYGPDRLPDAITVDLDGTSLELRQQRMLGELTFVATVQLEPGSHTMTVRQSASENYVVRLLESASPGPGEESGGGPHHRRKPDRVFA